MAIRFQDWLRQIQDWCLYLFARAFFGTVGLLPDGLAYAGCRWIARCVFRLDRKHRRIGLINLGFAFPDESEEWRLQVLKKSFEQLGDLAVEISRMARGDWTGIRQRVRYEPGFGLENYHLARAGRGVLFLTAHISAWELLPVAHCLLGAPLTFVVRPLDNAPLDRWVERVRSLCGNRPVAKSRVLLRLARSLKAGEDVGLLLDQNVMPSAGVFAPLFGKPASTSWSAAWLALKTGARIVPGFMLPDGQVGRYRIRFYPPLEFEPTQDEKQDLLRITTELNRHIEEVIREVPEGWLWGHRRYKTQPDGSDPYS